MGVVSGPEMIVVVVAAVLGGAAQSVLGFGAAFTTVPALALFAPELIPGAALLSFLPLTVTMAVRERETIDRSAAGRIMLARIPGIALGTLAVRLANPDTLAAGVAIILLAAVISSAMGWQLTPTPTAERITGVISGFSGTAVGLGGPPLAVLYRDRPARTSRPTLAIVFAVGIVMSLAALGLTGSLTAQQVVVGAQLAAAILVGMVVAAPLLRRLSDAHLRRGLLLWAGGGSIVALLRVALG